MKVVSIKKTKTIAISFTLEGQDFNKISEKLESIKADVESKLEEGEEIELAHGFMLREEVVKQKLSTEIVDKLDALFPRQVHFVNQGVADESDTERMADYVQQRNGDVYFIGDVKDNVLKDWDTFSLWLSESQMHTVKL